MRSVIYLVAIGFTVKSLFHLTAEYRGRPYSIDIEPASPDDNFFDNNVELSISGSHSRSLLQVQFGNEPSGGSAYQVDAVIDGITGANIRIAVLDSGSTTNHPALSKVVERLDFTSDGDPGDVLGHGTFVASVIAGNDPQCLGLAPDALLHIFRMFTADQTSYTSWFIDAFNYAMWAGVDVINLSVGGPDHYDAPFMEKISEMCAFGMIVVSANGNDGPLWGTHMNPADMSCVIGVGGLSADGSIASFSARGMTAHELHHHGYGRIKPDIVTLAEKVQGSAINSGCKTLTGTSVASPIVAGAVAMLLSSLPSNSLLRNPAAIKQSLIKTAERIAHSSMFEQGAGKMQVRKALQMLSNMKAHVSVFPSAIDFTDHEYFWPYSSQPIFASAEPVICNLTVLNSVGVEGVIVPESVLFTPALSNQPELSLGYSYSDLLWPWSGWFAVHIGVAHDVGEAITVSGQIGFTVRSGRDLHHVDIPLSVPVIPKPPRRTRLLWDQFHNVQFPQIFVPRDNLNEVVDTLDWHGDHLHTNFRTFYKALRSAGFYIDILYRDFTCIDAERYGALLIVDPEREILNFEIAQLAQDVMQSGLSVVVIADWFNLDQMSKTRFFDKNTQKWWEPFTGGANIPTINDLLRLFDIEFSDDVVEGVFRINGRPTIFNSGSSLRRFPAGGKVLSFASLSSSIGASGPIAIGGIVSVNGSRIAVFGDSNGIDDSQSDASNRADWLVLLLIEYATSGIVPDHLATGLTLLETALDSNRDSPVRPTLDFSPFLFGSNPFAMCPNNKSTFDVSRHQTLRTVRKVPLHVQERSAINLQIFVAIIVLSSLIYLLFKRRQRRRSPTMLPTNITDFEDDGRSFRRRSTTFALS